MSDFTFEIGKNTRFIHDETNRYIKKIKLNHDWTIVCVLDEERWIIKSIEIHRESTAGEVLISGELKFSIGLGLRYEKKFSQSIKSGSLFTVIDHNMKIVIPLVPLKGILKISNISQKPGTDITTEESKEKTQLKSLERLSKDLEHLMDPASPFADVTLKCGGVSIPAYKNLLSARSPVFAAMFANPMKESIKNVVDISDIDESALRALLNYIYTGKSPDLTVAFAGDLLFAADKYQLEDLKMVCSCFLKDALSLENVLRLLVLGDMFDYDLKSFGMDYICNSDFSVLEKMEEWENLRKKNPTLAMDVLTSLVKSRDEKLKG